MFDYENEIEKLIQLSTAKEFEPEVVEAKREFFERAGIVDEEAINFEMRMSQFLDWYMFSRELSDVHLPPVKYYLEKFGSQISEELRPYFENMTHSLHSLFEFLKIRDDNEVTIRDLFTKKKHVLQESKITAGFNPDEIFEARIIPHDKTWIFTRGFCFHPSDASKFILKEIKQVKNLDQAHREALMLRLMKMRYKFEQYKHIRLDYIYTNDAKLRL